MEKYTVTFEDIQFADNETGLFRLFAAECMTVETWRDEGGLIHRPEGPAITVRSQGNYDRDSVSGEFWFKRGVLHCDDGPAINICRPYDYAKLIQYYQDGKLHRTDGPADSMHDVMGVEINSRYFLNGKEVSKSGDPLPPSLLPKPEI